MCSNPAIGFAVYTLNARFAGIAPMSVLTRLVRYRFRRAVHVVTFNHIIRLLCIIKQ